MNLITVIFGCIILIFLGQPAAGANGWQEWESWANCSETCGYGIQNRSRTCLPFPAFCPTGDGTQSQQCNDTSSCTTELITTTPEPTTTTTPEPTTTTTPEATTTTTVTTEVTTQTTTSIDDTMTTTISEPTTTVGVLSNTASGVAVATTTAKGLRKATFTISITIIRFKTETFVCSDPDLADASTATYIKFTKVVCGDIEAHVKRLKICVISSITCGSFIVNLTATVEQRDDDAPADAAPANTAEFLTQINPIISDNSDEIVVTATPIVKDVNECEDSSLNGCSPNSACNNTDGYYSCSCNTVYPSDLSTDADKPGRICAKSCTGFCSSPEVTCEEKPEDEPLCTGENIAPWLIAVIVVSVVVVVAGVIVISVYLVKRQKNHDVVPLELPPQEKEQDIQ